MTECNNTEVRDLLPDYLVGGLPFALQSRVEAHLQACAACRDESALLRVARAVRPRATTIDVARIVAALPPRLPTPALQLVRDEPRAVSGPGTAPYGSADVIDLGARRRPVHRAAWRIAAAVGVALIGGWSALALRERAADDGGGARIAVEQGSATLPERGTVVALPLGETLASSTTGDPGASRERGVRATREARGGGQGTALSLGDLSEYSDEDLQRVLERLAKWDGATSADPLPAVPIVSVTERGTL